MKLLDGGSNTQIALALGIQRNTVNNYVWSLYKKTVVGNRKALVQWWMQRSTEDPRSFKRCEPPFSHHRLERFGAAEKS
jgi:hypothetical protein